MGTSPIPVVNAMVRPCSDALCVREGWPMMGGMGPVWVHLVGGVVMVTAMAVTTHLMRNRMPLSPRQARRQTRWTTPLVAAMFLGMAGFNWVKGQHSTAGFVALMALIMLASALARYLRSPRPIEEMQNFAAEPGRCGRCEYDLTGNMSGVCPECGWEIPRGALDVDSPGWMLWWRDWEIGHLRNWRTTLVFLVVMVLAFLAMGVVMGILFGAGTTIMPVVMGAYFGINVWRVVKYGREHRQGV